MRKQELQDLNAELVELLVAVRDQIDEKLDELAAVAEDEDDDADEDETADEDGAADDEADED